MAENEVQRAVRRCGGPTKASILTGMSASTIFAWMRENEIVDAQSAVLISERSGVPIRRLVALKGPPLSRNPATP